MSYVCARHCYPLIFIWISVAFWFNLGYLPWLIVAHT